MTTSPGPLLVIAGAFDQKRWNRVGGCMAFINHFVAQPLDNSDNRFETPAGHGILLDAVIVVLLRPVDDNAAAVGMELGAGLFAMALHRAQNAPVLKTRDHISVDAVRIRMHVEGFVSSDNLGAAEVRDQSRFDIVFKFGVKVGAGSVPKSFGGQAFAERIIWKKSARVEHTYVYVTVVAYIGAVA